MFRRIYNAQLLHRVPSVKDYSAYVNPFIGTGGHGHTFPGAVVPHGMIQPSPDTRIDGWDACSGYYYDDNTINGFSHTHVSGTGCCDYGDVLLMPIVGKPQYLTTDPESQKLAYASAFSHENETAEPGYYSVFLDTYQVKAEITATKRGAIHRYTFPKAQNPDLSSIWTTACNGRPTTRWKSKLSVTRKSADIRRRLTGLSTSILTSTPSFPNRSHIPSSPTLSQWTTANACLYAKPYCTLIQRKTKKYW